MISNPLVINCLLGILLSLLVAAFSNCRERAFRWVSLLLCSTMVILRSFMDINSLPDLPEYEQGFIALRSISWGKVPNEWIGVKIDEVGFRFFLKIVGLFSDNFHVFLFVMGIVWMALYYKTIKRYSPYVVVSLLLVLVGSFNQSLFVIRQHLAMAICFYSYKYIISKDIKSYLITILLAFLMHQTALVFLPLYFVYHIKNRRTLLLTIFIGALLMYLSFSYLLNQIGGNMLTGYSSYLESDEGTNAMGFLIMLSMLLCYCLFLRRNAFNEGINKLLLISLLFGTTLCFVGIGFNPTGRLAMYYSSTAFLAIPIIMQHISSRLIRYSFLSVVYTLFFSLSFWGSNSTIISNYSF